MKFLSRSFAIFAVATRRLLSQRGLALATAVGLVASIALVMSVPLYTDAVYYRILQEELSNAGEDDAAALSRPPFAFMFRYVGSLYGMKEWDDITQVDEYLMEQGVPALGLPHKMTVRYATTDNSFRQKILPMPMSKIRWPGSTMPLSVTLKSIPRWSKASTRSRPVPTRKMRLKLPSTMPWPMSWGCKLVNNS
jgi:hypothetical protein